MRSRAELRAAIEWLMRLALLAGLALALWRSMHPDELAATTTVTDTRGLIAALTRATTSQQVRSLNVHVDSMPDSSARAWLVGMRRAGVNVQWSGHPPALAAQVERTAEPESRARMSVVADSAHVLAVSDSAGPLDSLRISSRGASVENPAMVSVVRVRDARWVASAAVPEQSAPHAVLVLGRAGWESRFTGVALQEAGWTVRSRQPAAPGVIIADAGILPIDTSRYSAVVALDSTAADLAPALARFVAQGGGLVLAGDAAALPALVPLSPARLAAREPGRILLDADSVTRNDLPLRALVALRGDAVRLDVVRAGAASAARRAGLGRVVTLGYDESWRWRMLGGTSGVAAHRAWWSRTVALVASSSDTRSIASADAAPTAALIAAIGPATNSEAHDATQQRGKPLTLAFLALLIALLLAETASRRFRGAP